MINKFSGVLAIHSIKRTFILTVLIIISATQVHTQENTKPFAVVELFTSEGCSSCPPADALLRELTRLADEENRRIFTLGYHVDYWNYLGWTDRFSDAAYSQRQRQYAKALGSTSVYTPQLIINGTNAFGGYRGDLAQQGIDAALQQRPQVALDITFTKNTKKELQVDFQTSAVPKNSVLNVVLVERGLSNRVTAGENKGRNMAHDNVVRAFTAIPLHKRKGSLTISKPLEVKTSKSSLIAFLQNKKTMQIIGADMINLAP